MARIAGVNIPTQKRVEIGLRYIHGIGAHTAHKIINPYLYRVDEVLEILQQISAPVLAVEASDDSLGQWWKGKYTLDEYHQRLQSVPRHRIARIENASHMLHHDQPQALAQLLQDFLTAAD